MNAIEQLLGDSIADRAEEGDPIAGGIDSLREVREARGVAEGYDVHIHTTYVSEDGNGGYFVEVQFRTRSVKTQPLCKYTAEALFEKLVRDYDLEEGDFDGS